jgi:hypothetical protein
MSMSQTKTFKLLSSRSCLVFISSLLIAGSLASYDSRKMGYGFAKANEADGNAEDCQDLPHSDFLNAQQLDFICDHRKMWLQDRDSQVSKKDFVSQATCESMHFSI